MTPSSEQYVTDRCLQSKISPCFDIAFPE